MELGTPSPSQKGEKTSQSQKGETTSQRQQMGPGSWRGLRRLPAGPLELPRPPLQDPDPLQPPKYCTSEATAGGALLYVAVYSSSQRTAISPGHNPKTRDLSSQSPHNPPSVLPVSPQAVSSKTAPTLVQQPNKNLSAWSQGTSQLRDRQFPA